MASSISTMDDNDYVNEWYDDRENRNDNDAWRERQRTKKINGF